MQKLDVGIALAHFMLALEEAGIAASAAQDDPGIPCEKDAAYIATVKAGGR